jgi:hydroxypyruvate isomerase
MRLGANLSLLYTDLPLLERIAAAMGDGFDGVEIQYPYEPSPAALRSALEAAGAPLALINTPPGPNGEPGLGAVAGREAAFREGMQRALDLASATGCPRIHTMPGRPLDRAPARWHPVFLDNLRWAAPLARERGIVLTLEPLNHWDQPGYAYHTPAEALPLLQTLDDPAVMLQFDLYHVRREGLDLLATLEACRPWIGHVQFAEPPGRTTPDLAHPEVRQAITRLRETGYTGWLAAEYKPGGPTASTLGWMPALRAVMGPAAVP